MSDPDSDQARLEVEVQPTSVAFDGTGTVTGSLVSSGSTASATVTGLTAGTTYHWRARAVDSNGVPSTSWVSFPSGSPNAETSTDFYVNDVPDDPTVLAQFQSDGTTAIATGGASTNTSVVLKGTVSDPDSNQAQLQVEVKAVGTAFNGTTGLTTGSLVNSGTTASATATGLTRGTNYHWRARTVDSNGAVSAWVTYPTSGNDESATDFSVTQLPADASSLAQFQSDGTTAIATGAAALSTSVVLKATLSDPDLDQVQLQVEVKTVGTSFNGTSGLTTGSLVNSGQTASATVTGLTVGNDYHWRARALDANGVASTNWVSYPTPTANSESVADFYVNDDPNTPTSLAQFQSDGSTSISTGGAATSTTVVLKATVSDPDSNQVKLEVEVKPVGTAFDGTSTFTGSLVSSGSTASATVTGLTFGANYHWRARAVDSNDVPSASWASYPTGSPNAETATDFTVTHSPNDASNLAQFQSDGTTAIATGGASLGTSVVLKATVSDPDLGDQVRLEVEVKQVGTSFSGSGTVLGSLVSNGSTASVTVSSLGVGNDYHWRARAVDANGAAGNWVSYPTPTANLESAVDFYINTAPSNISSGSLAQYQADGTTLIATGGTANSGTVVLKGTVSDPDSDQVKLEVEVKPTNVAFNGTGTVVDGFVASGQTALATVSGLNASTNYHWRARAVDANGVPSSSWTSYGGNSDTLTAATDFVTKAAPVATSGTATTNEDTPTTITLAGTTINTDELFSSTFGSVTTNTVSVDGWVDSDGSGSACNIDNGSPRGGPTDEHARLSQSCSITRSVSTTGRTGVKLNYYWRGDSDADSLDKLFVQWRVGTSGTFNDLVAGGHVLTTTSWSSLQTLSLPAAADNQATIQIRFAANATDSAEEARVDDVSVVGTPGLSFKVTNLPSNGDLYDGPNTSGHLITAAEATAGYTVLDASHRVTYNPDLNYNNTSLTPDTFQFKVNDGAFDSAAGTVSITVNPVNDPPVLAAIGDQNVNEQSLLSFTASASDPDSTVSYSLVNGTTSCGSVTSCTVPGGASINGSSGAFAWTPTEAQGPGTYRFKVKVTDNGSPVMSDDEEITVTVAEVNVAPVLAAIGNKNVDELVELTFSASATDADVPANGLSYSLANGTGTCAGGTTTKPANASINSSTGDFSWTPTEAQGRGDRRRRRDSV